MDEDPIVNEVRKARKQHAAEFGFDAGGIVEDIKISQKKYGPRLVRRPPKLKLKATES
jgi:hypothetical protein